MAKHYWNKDYYFKKAQGSKLPDYNLDPPEDDDFEEEMGKNLEDFEIPENLLNIHSRSFQPNNFHF
jgi:hypothetical protein